MAKLHCFKTLTVAVAISVAGWSLAGPRPAGAEAPNAPNGAIRPEPNVFQRFATALSERPMMVSIIRLFREKRYDAAEKVLHALVEKFPNSALYRYNLAAAQARQGKTDAAFDSLNKAVALGFASEAIAARDPDLESLHGDARFKPLLAKLRTAAAEAKKRAAFPVRPARVMQGRAVVGVSNTSWEPRSNLLISRFAFPPKASTPTVHGGQDPVAKLLNAWYAAGKAAGNNGDLYDNRDRGHSRFSAALMPQVAHTIYSPEAHEAGVDYGVNPGILFNAITFGNSSTALTNTFAWRSQARLILTSGNLIERAYLQYANNALYVYPEHLDHDTGRGDLMPANTPYMIVSQGSSGSDQPFLHAVGAILAAFRPTVKNYLRQHHLIMPTVQMIFRRGQKQVRDDADYLSSKAHPSVFLAKNIDLVRMVKLAQSLTVDAIPPVVTLAVVDEDKAKPGIDYFGPPELGERLFDTPSAIARLVRATRYTRHLVVSASGTVDPNGRPLTFHWALLQGDADRVKITPLGKTGDRAEIRVSWHDRFTVPGFPELKTDRVDIGVFASNGKYFSAPAFVSFFYPADQKRSYGPNGRIHCIDYDDPAFRKRYVDPLLYPSRDWRDCYQYDDAGRLLGWNRVAGGSVQRFTRDGEKVIETDNDGRPILAEAMEYAVAPTKEGRPKIVQHPAGHFVSYHYTGDGDRFGTPSPVKK